jgi:hypothetical protein
MTRTTQSGKASLITRAVMTATVDRSAMRTEALDRARNGQSTANYTAIIQGFVAMGVPEDDIKPRENVFTYDAWLAQGRQVNKGQHGVKVTSYVEVTKKSDDPEKEPESFKRPRTTTVFHISQTSPIGQQ